MARKLYSTYDFSKNLAPSVKRSAFNLSHEHKTTFNVGKLVPIEVMEVLPGDTFSYDLSSVIRTNTFQRPVMDNLYADFMFFFVPMRLTWKHWKNFQGENGNSFGIPSIEYRIPSYIAGSIVPDSGVSCISKSVADYMGIPVGTKFDNRKDYTGPSTYGSMQVSQLPFRAFASIWNYWFRDENLQGYEVFDDGDSDRPYFTSDTPVSLPFAWGNPGSSIASQELPPVCKLHDYFTSALPYAQKGDPITLSLAQGIVPVVTLRDNWDESRLYDNPLRGVSGDLNSPVPTAGQVLAGFNNDGVVKSAPDDGLTGPNVDAGVDFIPSNLGVDTDTFHGVSVSALRTAFQMQKMLERDARGGTRYSEILYNHFGVRSPDSRLQNPEYLGGKRIPLNVMQVTQTSSTDTTSPQGNVSGMSVTADRGSYFTYSATEHGYIIGVCCVRYKHTYQQGVAKMFTRQRREEFYMPVFANISEQAILKREIAAAGAVVSGTFASNLEPFGYQEAWADYRNVPNRVSGEMRSNLPDSKSQDFWHFADNYSAVPSLGSDWIKEDKTNVERTLALTDVDQLQADFYFKVKSVRPMPLYSIPGLVDHH